ncbi:MAG: type II secretion system protein [Parcubacteria group bacterium]
MTKIPSKQKGFSLIEMLVYISILVFMLAVIMDITISMVRSERVIRASRNVENSASIALERIVREMRQADSINTTSSIFGSNPGVLVLQGTDTLGDPRTVEFYVSSETLLLKENGLDLGTLTEADARVTDLVFNYFSGSNSEGVRIEMTIESGESPHYRSEHFYASAILR